MKKKGIAIWSLVLRILTLVSLALSVAVLVTDNIYITGSLGQDDIEGSFIDVLAYRYMLSVALIAAAYTLLQLHFAIYYACKGRRAYKCLPDLDFYGDKLISLLLATAVGAGFAVSAEFIKFLGGTFGDLTDFYERGNIATSVLLVGTVCMAVVSVLSSINRSDSQV